MNQLYSVRSEVVSADGGNDAAEPTGTFTADELAKAIAAQLVVPVREMLLRGGNEPVGHELRIVIRDKHEKGHADIYQGGAL